MDTQTTTEALKEISERYELYKELRKKLNHFFIDLK